MEYEGLDDFPPLILHDYLYSIRIILYVVL